MKKSSANWENSIWYPSFSLVARLAIYFYREKTCWPSSAWKVKILLRSIVRVDYFLLDENQMALTDPESLTIEIYPPMLFPFSSFPVSNNKLRSKSKITTEPDPELQLAQPSTRMSSLDFMSDMVVP